MGQPRQAGFSGPLAQMVEHRHHTPRVTGSSPVRSTMRSLSGCKTRRGMSTGHQPVVRVRFPPQSATCSRATMVKSVRWGLIAPVASWSRCRQGYSSAAICSMRTNGTCGCDSHCPAYGLLAQWTERLVTSQDVAGSSPARPAGVNFNRVGIVGSGGLPRLVILVISIKVAGSAPETLNARGEDVRRSDLVSGNADLGEARTKRSPTGGVRLGAGLGNEAMQPGLN